MCGVALKTGADRLQKALQELHYTETEEFASNLSNALAIQMVFSDADQLQLLFFPDGKVCTHITNPYELWLEDWYFEIQQKDLDALSKLITEIIEENITNLASLIYTNKSAKLAFQNTYNNGSAVEVTAAGEIDEIYAVFESFTGTPVYDLEKVAGCGYQFSFSYPSGEKRLLIIDPDEPYISFSYESADTHYSETVWYEVPYERWQVIVTEWMFKWEIAMRSHTPASAPK